MPNDESLQGKNSEQIASPLYIFQSRDEYINQLTVTQINSSSEEKNYDDCIHIFIDKKKGDRPNYAFSRLSSWNQTVIRSKINRDAIQFVDRFWWLQTAWQERLKKGSLREQFVVGVNGDELDIYNFGKVLSDKEKTLFQSIIGRVASYDPTVFQNGLWIGLHDDEMGNSKEDEPITVAVSYTKKSFLEINQAGIRDGAVDIARLHEGIGDFPVLQLVLPHELGHFVAVLGKDLSQSPLFRFKDPWIAATGWEIENGKWVLKKSKAPSTYALDAPDEDHADSLVYYLYRPNLLDDVRHKYFTARDAKLDPPQVTMERKVGNRIKLPVAPSAKLAYRLM